MVRWAIVAVVLGAMSATSAAAQDRAVEVRATCVDARNTPHPASQTFGEREAPADFSGELFRCLAGTRLRYDVDHVVRDCAAGEALWLGAGALSCRAAAEHPREHDRELLRQHGAGVKLVRLTAEAAPASPQPGMPANPYPYRRN